MEMKRDEAPAAEEFDLIGELREAYRVQSKDAAYLMFDEKGAESERVQLRANLMYMAADALAAERDRADRAEAEVTRMQMVRDALTAFEDGEIEHLVAFVREIDRIANNTKDDELSEATA